MQVKKFEAPSLDEALTKVKESFGPSALILSTAQRRQRWFNRETVEVTAAFDPPKDRRVANLEQVFDENSLSEIFPHRRVPTPLVGSLNKSSATEPTKPARYVDIPGSRKRNPNTVRVEERFTALGLSTEFSKDLSRQLVFEYPQKDLALGPTLEKAMARILTGRIRSASPELLLSEGDWVPVGLPGSGRTTFLVKLAICARARSKPSALVGLDRTRILAKETLGHYSRLIQVPFYNEKSVGRSRELIRYMDCTGLPLGQGPDEWESYEKLLSNKRTFLLVDAGMRLKELDRLYEQVYRFSPVGVVLTKIDLVSELGPMFEFLKNTKLPLLALSLCRSFKVPVRFPDEKEFAMLTVRHGVVE